MNAERLMRTLKARHVSISDMCQQLGMSRSAFYRKTRGISEFTEGEIERGTKNPSLQVAREIARQLGCRTEDFFDGPEG